MKLSISTRIAEGFLSKEVPLFDLPELATLAAEAGYEALCMRASQVGVRSTPEEVAEARAILDDRGLEVSMVTGDFNVVYNNEKGPECLRDIGPYLDLAEALGAPRIRVCLRTEEDVIAAREASDRAVVRGIQLLHQCHVLSLFETVDSIVETLERIDRPNFGLIYEAGNLEECGQDYGLETIHRVAPWIRNVYLQNQVLRPDGSGAINLETWCRGPVSFDVLPMTDPGGIDFPLIFEGLREIGYDGPVTVHQAAQDEGSEQTPLEAATETADFLRGLIAS